MPNLIPGLGCRFTARFTCARLDSRFDPFWLSSPIRRHLCPHERHLGLRALLRVVPANGRASTIDPLSAFFPPENGEGKEAGLKFSLLKNKLTGTVALFRVDKTNVRRVNPGAAVLGINGAILTDGERSDGYEVDLVWTPTKNFTAILSGAHIDARVVADVINTASSPDLNGDGKPDTLGLPLVGSSPNSYSLWTKYEFTQKPLAGLSFSAGYQRREGPIALDA